ncbi:MAG: hypothetical protein JW956_01325 [Calditrichaceae bacterium]|nr:hypothetical protein [Calditrichaceae bacterium]
MKFRSVQLIITLFILLSILLTLAVAQEQPANKSQVTVSWDEFKKLLNFDGENINIPLQTFNKLLAQTGVKTVPPYTIKDGNVILSKAEFQKLVDQMKAPADPAANPPFEYLITKSEYNGKMNENATDFTGTFKVHVLKEEGFLNIPILRQNMAINELTVDNKPALVVSEGGYHKVILKGKGEYTVKANFSVKSSLDRGPHKIDLYIQQTPITLLNLEIPIKDADLEIPQAQQIASRIRGNSTLVSAILAPGTFVSVEWRKKAPEAEKIPAKLYAEVYHLISIEDDAFKINSEIVYNILHSEIDGVRFTIPENMSVLNVSGEGIGEWQEIAQNNQRVIQVPFTYGKKGSVRIYVSSETPLTENGMANAFIGFKALDCVRETGFIAVELNTSAEVILAESEGLEKIAVQKLPQVLFNKSVKPLLFGFKYLKHPFNAVFDVKKHEKIAVPMAVINSSNAVTLFTEDGKIIHRIIYNVRNSAKQFMEIALPENADVWSVFVGNQPVESSLNSQGKLLIPLIRSRSTNDQLDTFPVEIIYALAGDRFDSFGKRSAVLPEVDLIVSQMIWSVYLPNDYTYNYFSSTLEKEESLRGVGNLFGDARRDYDSSDMDDVLSELSEDEEPSVQVDKLKRAYSRNESKSSFRNVPMPEEQIARQMQAEVGFSNRMEGLQKESVAGTATGILPIQIQIPTSGQVYRFARTIIKSDDVLSIQVYFSSSWTNDVLRWLIYILFVLVLWLLRKQLVKLINLLKSVWMLIYEWYNQHSDSITKIAQSKMTLVVIFGLLMITWTFNYSFLTVILFFLFWVSVVYHILNYRRTKSSEKIEVKLPEENELEVKSKPIKKTKDNK